MHRYGLADRQENLTEPAGQGGLDLEQALLGVEFDEDIALFNAVAGVFEPAADRP
jgi:hypothetical protein